ncbi:MAG TPA: amino acid adenylation domain-containing protein [Ktedonobacteraceae bacterium]|jgi:amino acid adenylation domain-containing protein|nr:amino acid adenylation domain-containing protein [Ktedonobacteraceae bacterium]
MNTEDTFLKRRAELSAAKQALLEKRLRYMRVPASPAGRTATLEPTETEPPPEKERGPAPLSFAQQRLWFLQRLEPESSAYNEPIAVYMRGTLNIEALTQTAREITRRHEILRSTFPMIDGQVVQVIDPTLHLNLTLPFIDLRGIPAVERETAVQRKVKEELERPFHLEREMPWRTVLLQLDEQEHVSLTIMHHIITDGWSAEVFVKEIGILYSSFAAGQTPPLPELKLQYADYARWQRRELESGRLDRQLAYWKRQLSGDLPILELPADHPRPAVSTYQGKRLPLRLPLSLSQELSALSRQEGVTLFMALLAAFQVLLYRYSGQEDLLIGTPIAGRTRPEFEGLLGCFVNTLVLRTNLAGHPSFRALLKRVRQVTLGAYDSQDLPFEKLVEDLQPERSLSHNPLFQVMFILQNMPLAEQELAGLTISQVAIENNTAKFDLSLCLQETPEGLTGFIEYNTDLFETSTIERMAGHFQRVLEMMVANPEQKITAFTLLSPGELQQQLIEWNATEKTYPITQCFPALFEAQVERTPNAVAVVCQQEALTYRQLNQSANGLAHELRALGVGPDTLVGLLAERGIDLLTAILAVFKAGGAYLPLDPHHPPARMRHIIKHSHTTLVLASQPFVAQIDATVTELAARPRILTLEDMLDRHWQGMDDLQPVAEPHHLAYVIYTSGSTGTPKGVMIEQRGMLNHLFAKIDALQLTDADDVAQTASQCFDISVWQMLAALLVGGQVHILPDEIAHDPARLLSEVESWKISILETVPSLLRAMLDAREADATGKPALSSLRWLIPTGEALPVDLCRRWLELYPHCPVMNAYGPTECSDDVTHHAISRPPAETERTIPIGRPIPNMRTYVLDAMLQPVPVGASGELYVGGIGVGRGYLGEAARTAEAFIPDPFSNESGARLYKTGDQVRYHSDGILEFLGRIDHQVKLHGYRIELGEIEAGLTRHAGVRECAVLLREDTPGKQSLVAYIVPQPGHDLQSDKLSGYMKDILPEYMVPSAFVMMHALPLTANGKLDRKALPAPDQADALSQAAFVAPRTPIEEKLAKIWRDVLEVERIGIHDNFFEAGGHSLLITQVVARIRDAFEVELPLRVLFKTPTIAGVAEAIEKMKTRTDELRKPSLIAVAREAHRIQRSSLE